MGVFLEFPPHHDSRLATRTLVVESDAEYVFSILVEPYMKTLMLPFRQLATPSNIRYYT